MAEHTPGPWTYIEPAGHYREPLDYIVGTTEGWGQTVARINPCNQSEANARLMAAAPDLLAALKDLNFFLHVAEMRFGSDEQKASCDRLMARANAVIAKAHGESSGGQ